MSKPSPWKRILAVYKPSRWLLDLAGVKGDVEVWRNLFRRRWPQVVEWFAPLVTGAGALIVANPIMAFLAAFGVLIVVRLTLRVLLVRRRARQDDTRDTLTVTLPDGSTRAYPKLARLDPDTGGPAAGWMRFYEAVRLAEEYALPIKEMTTRETVTLLVEEFVEQHPEHFDERTGFVERVPLTRWLLSHRVPMPYRWRWRRKALGLVYDEEGRGYFVPSERRRPLRDDE